MRGVVCWAAFIEAFSQGRQPGFQMSPTFPSLGMGGAAGDKSVCHI